MNPSTTLLKQAFFLTYCVALLLTGCSTRKNSSPAGQAIIPIYDTAEKIKAMPPCQATVGRPGTHWASFKTADGMKFCLGSPGATPEVRQFLQTLQAGQTYELPKTFLAYQQK